MVSDKFKNFYIDLFFCISLFLACSMALKPQIDRAYKPKLEHYQNTDYPTFNDAVDAPEYTGRAVDARTGALYYIKNTGAEVTIKTLRHRDGSFVVIPLNKNHERKS